MNSLKGITIGLGRIKDCTVTPLFLASNLNLRPMGVVWFRFPWSAVYITATSAWPPKSNSTERPQTQSGIQRIGTITGTTVKRDCVFLRPARLTKRHLVTQN